MSLWFCGEFRVERSNQPSILIHYRRLRNARSAPDARLNGRRQFQTANKRFALILQESADLMGTAAFGVAGVN